MKSRNTVFFSMVILALTLVAFIVVAQFFTNKSTIALTQGNIQAVKTIIDNNAIQEMVNLSFDLENKMNRVDELADNARRHALNDSLLALGYNASILTQSVSEEAAATAEAINNAIDAQVTISEKILEAVEKADLALAVVMTDSLKMLNLGSLVYDNCIKLQETLRDKLQETLDTNADQARKLSLFNRILALFSIIAILVLTTIIIRRQSQQLKLIEELKVAELAALKSKRAKDEFLANMSHELRTPLNALIGFGNLLSSTRLDSQQKEYTDVIKSSGYNLLYIVNDILDFSKIEAGKLTIAHRPFNLYHLLNTIEKMFSVTIAEKGLYYKSFINYDVPEHVAGDPDRLQQIFVNLINNAIKFTREGGIEVSAGTVWIDESKEYFKLSFTVKDSGVGIPGNKIETVFERFEQLEQGVQKQYGGTGLGLTIVKNLVEKMGGAISVYSQLHEGSEFNFTCILERANIVTTEKNKEFDYTPGSFNGCRVLIVEDNKANQTLLKHIFNRYQLEFKIVGNGQEAIGLLRQESFDLVFMDIQMPVLDGYSAINVLRNQLHLQIPVIAMTAYVLEGEEAKCLAAGFSDYIAKPVNEALLMQKIWLHLVDRRKDGQKSAKLMDDSRLDFLKQIVGNDAATLKEILEEMQTQWAKDREDLKKAAAENNGVLLRQALHGLKSTFSALGPDHAIYRIINDKAPSIIEGSHISQADCAAMIEQIEAEMI